MSSATPPTLLKLPRHPTSNTLRLMPNTVHTLVTRKRAGFVSPRLGNKSNVHNHGECPHMHAPCPSPLTIHASQARYPRSYYASMPHFPATGECPSSSTCTSTPGCFTPDPPPSCRRHPHAPAPHPAHANKGGQGVGGQEGTGC